MQRKPLQPLFMTALLFAGAACGTADPTELASVHVKTAMIDAAAGGTIEVTASDEYAPFIGTKVVVPAGALSADTELTVDIFSNSLMDADANEVGPAVTFGPAGTQFSQPVEVTLPITEAIDADLVRVYVQNADMSREVILPTGITIDAAQGVVRFSVEHFTTFQPGRARGACRHLQCPSNQCSGGRCVTPNGCTNTECGPGPALPTVLCPDGTSAGPVCERAADGTCGWHVPSCSCSADSDCPPGQLCDPNNGTCVVGGGVCGNSVCSSGTVCCNAACGICAPPGVACTQQACLACTTNADCQNPSGGNGTCVNGYCR